FVPKLRSHLNIVIAPANTGIDNNLKYVVTIIDHGNNGEACRPVPRVFMLNNVTMKLIEPAIDDSPAICLEKIPKSVAGPSWNRPLLLGGYIVQPVPIPCPIEAELVIR